MRVKTILAAITVTAVAAALLVPAEVAGAQGKKAKAKVVGEDPADDWGEAVDPTLAPLGDVLGQEMVAASIGMADKKTVNFIITLNSLPPNGGVPELSRYTWDFLVDGEFTELDGKYTNYSRGICDPTSGQCPPPRDPGLYPFFVRGNCGAVGSVTTCEELGLVEAVFDAEKATITIPVPLKLIKAKPGSKIAPGTNLFGGSISAAPSAIFTSAAMPMDLLLVTGTFKVPGKKKK
jgi:hypothetical protein